MRKSIFLHRDLNAKKARKNKNVFFSMINFLNTFPRTDFCQMVISNNFSTLELILKVKKMTSGFFRTPKSKFDWWTPKLGNKLPSNCHFGKQEFIIYQKISV